MKTIDSYLFNKYNKSAKIKKVKPVKISSSNKSNTSNKKDENKIHIDFPDDDIDAVNNYPEKRSPLINKDKLSNPVKPSILGNIDLIKRKKRYEESIGVVMRCSECGTISAYAKKTSDRSDIVNIECCDCFREVNLKGYLSFSDNPFYQRTKNNRNWFDNNIKELLIKEKPRVVKF